MKASKKCLERAWDHGQHVLDKYDWKIWHAVTGNTFWTSMIVTQNRCTISPTFMKECMNVYALWWDKQVDLSGETDIWFVWSNHYFNSMTLNELMIEALWHSPHLVNHAYGVSSHSNHNKYHWTFSFQIHILKSRRNPMKFNHFSRHK